jgi:hypothetical protein
MGPLHGLDAGFVAVVTLAAFVATAGAVLVSGFLPRTSGPAAGRGALGAALVYLAVALVAGLAIAAVAAATALPWAVALVVIGLAFLTAPFAVQPLPDSVRESRAGLVAVVALSAAMLVLLPMPGFL